MTTIDVTRRPRLEDLKPLGGPAASDGTAPRPGLEAAVEAAPRVTPAAAFADRPGYSTVFLGDFVVPLPEPQGRRARDVLKIPGHDDRLDYQHFSIVMSASRRIAMFVACNVDGAQTVPIERARDRWAFDGRIPSDAQIGDDLYARNDLDRGHLVRREDPNWGTMEEATTANEDTFHFTNCSPQMATFNQQTWLGLENYVLGNAKIWKERVTVLTGPVFTDEDMVYRDVPLPSAFWKVVAFITDDGRPSATAYMIDQKRALTALEAAYGRYRTYQRSVRRIEEITGLGFGPLRDFDGFSNEERRTGTRIEVELRHLGDIRV
jgi:endonuclease G